MGHQGSQQSFKLEPWCTVITVEQVTLGEKLTISDFCYINIPNMATQTTNVLSFNTEWLRGAHNFPPKLIELASEHHWLELTQKTSASGMSRV